MRSTLRIPRRLLTGLLCLALLSGAAGAGAAGAQEAPGRTGLAIYSTGDMHARIYSQDPLTGEKAESSYLKVAAAMSQERAQTADTLLLDSGDAAAGGLVSGYDLGLSDDPLAFTLRTIGYDALVPAAGEFRADGRLRAELFEQLTGETGAGAPVSVLSANWLAVADQSPLAEPYRVFPLTDGEQTWRVGVVGLGGMDVPGQVPEDRYEGSVFAHGRNTQGSYAWEWNYFWQQRLEAEDCDLVVAVCHADADGLTALVSQTTGIDLVVGGHGQPGVWLLTAADGAQVPCVSGGGSYLTKTVLTVQDGALAVGESTLLELASYSDSVPLSTRLDPAYAAARELAGRSVGTLAGDWEDEGGQLYRQSQVADLVAASMAWASGADVTLLSPAALGALSPASLFREGFLTAPVSLADCFGLYPRQDSVLLMVEMTGGQLRGWLELCAQRYGVTDGFLLSGGENADVLYGLDYEVYLGGPEGQRVAGLPEGGERTYRVALDSARLADPEFPSVTVLWSAAADARFGGRGGSIPAVLAAYVEEVTRQSGYLTPARESAWALYPGEADGPLTRLELVSLLYDLAGKPAPTADAAFVDVSGVDAVVWAAECGVASGDGQGKFLPAKTVTREQAAVMIYGYARTLGLSSPATGTPASLLADYGGIAAWARSAVDFCVRTGALPASGGRFRPQDTLTRGEITQYLDVFARLAP